MPDYDQLYKRLIRQFFKWFIKFFCPELFIEIDFSVPPEFIDKELYTDQVQGEKRYTDILIKVRLINGSFTYIIIHIEIQREMPIDFSRRMFDYYKVITLHYKTPVFALVVYVGDSKNCKNLISYFEEKCFGTKVRYDYEVRNLKSYDYHKYINHNNPIVVALIAHMNHSGESKALVMAESLKALSRFSLTEKEIAQINNFLIHILNLNSDEESELYNYLTKSIFKEANKMLSPYEEMVNEMRDEMRDAVRDEVRDAVRDEVRNEVYEKAREDVREEVYAKVREEGKEEEAKGLLLKQMEVKWGKLETNVRERLNNITTLNKLEALGEKLIVCNDVDELFI